MRIFNAVLAVTVVLLSAIVVARAAGTFSYDSGFPAYVTSIASGIPATYGEGFTGTTINGAPCEAWLVGNLNADVEGENKSGGAVVWERMELRATITGATSPRWVVWLESTCFVRCRTTGAVYDNPDSSYWARAYAMYNFWGDEGGGQYHQVEVYEKEVQISGGGAADEGWFEDATMDEWERTGPTVRFGIQIDAQGGIITGRSEHGVRSDVTAYPVSGRLQAWDGADQIAPTPFQGWS